MLVLPATLYLFTFWAFVVFHRGPFRVFRALTHHYVLYMGAFFLATWVHPWFAFLPIFSLALWYRLGTPAARKKPATKGGVRFIPKALATLFVCSVLLAILLVVVPLAETDSVGYMLPMADGARILGTAGVWITDTVRAIRRIWGLASHASVYLHWSSGAIHGVEVVVLPGYIALVNGTYLLARHLGVHKAKAYIPALLIATLPPIFISLFTLKDDMLFAAFALALAWFHIRPWGNRWTMLALWMGAITSKLFYLLLGLLLIPFWRRWCPRLWAMGGLALLLVLGLNYQRIRYAYSGVSFGTVGLALTGTTTAELGLNQGNPKLPFSLPNPVAYAQFWWEHLHGFFHTGTPWWHQPVFYPNYTSLLLATLLLPLGIYVGRRSRWLYAGLFYAMGIMVLSPNPAHNHIRYLLIPVIILLVLACKQFHRLARYVIYVQCGLIACFLVTGPVYQAIIYAMVNDRPAFALEVASLNYGLPPKPLTDGPPPSPIVVVSTYQTSPEYLFTDNSVSTIRPSTLQYQYINKHISHGSPRSVLLGLDFVHPRSAQDRQEYLPIAARLGALGWHPRRVVADKFVIFSKP